MSDLSDKLFGASRPRQTLSEIDAMIALIDAELAKIKSKKETK